MRKYKVNRTKRLPVFLCEEKAIEKIYESIVANAAWFFRVKKEWNEESVENWSKKNKDFAKTLKESKGDLDLADFAQMIIKDIAAAEQSNSLTTNHKSIIKFYAS